MVEEEEQVYGLRNVVTAFLSAAGDLRFDASHVLGLFSSRPGRRYAPVTIRHRVVAHFLASASPLLAPFGPEVPPLPACKAGILKLFATFASP